MPRSSEYWFEFNGAKSTDLGVQMTDAHRFSRGACRGSREEVPGRSGDIWLGDGAMDAFEIERACLAPASKLRQISAWLTGEGSLRFSNEPNLAYDARAAGRIDYRRVSGGDDPLYEFTAAFLCQPFPRVYPEPAPVEIDRSGATLENPGTAPSLPRIEIEGSGSFCVTIGAQTMFFSGVENGIVVDSELMDALTPDGAQLANDKIDGDFFEIQPGQSVVQWIEGGTDGDGAPLPGELRKLTITPRWRML